MLKDILSPSDCAKCRVCCVFDHYDLWESPIIPDEMKKSLSELDPELEFIPRNDSWVFNMNGLDDGLYYCPMLTDTGCRLGDSKPFDCRIWPYRVMNFRGRFVITIASICPVMYKKPLNALIAELDGGLANIIFAEAENNPDIIKEYDNSYPILKVGGYIGE